MQGWFDPDLFLAPNFKTVLTEYMQAGYDIITFPDGGINALYLAGQLTVFKNSDHFRNFYLKCPKVCGSTETLMCVRGNRIFDEKYAIHG